MKTDKSNPHSGTIDRKLGSKEQIWAELNKSLRRRLAGMADRDIALPLLTRIDEPVPSGSNWFIEWSGHAQGHNALVREVVEEIRGKWNLR